MSPPSDDLLLIVLGPGVGESVLVGWPPNSWLVVDSFCRSIGTAEIHPAVEALEAFGGTLEAVALTHPHEDHTRGFASLIERLAEGGKVGWWPSAVTDGGRWSTSNAALAQRNGANEQAVAAIHRIWADVPSCKWDLVAGQPSLELSGVSVDVLAPLLDTVEDHRNLSAPNVNELSSAMRVQWRECTLLLGADLVNSRGWDRLEVVHGPLAFSTSSAMKIAHHGSREAQHAVALGAALSADRTLVGSPFNRGGKVPDYTDGEDVDLLLALAEGIYMTGHHGSRPPNSGSLPVPRSSLLPNLRSLTGGIGPVNLDAEQPPIGDCWVATRIDENGVVVSIERGPGSLHVVI